MTMKEELLECWEKLGPNAQRVLLALAARLAMGAKKYGDFPIRKWTREAAEEALDGCVYLTAELLAADLQSKDDLTAADPASSSP
jgi:hypothetical protein